MTEAEFAAVREEVRALRQEVDALKAAPRPALHVPRIESHAEWTTRFDREQKAADRPFMVLACVVAVPFLLSAGVFAWVFGTGVANWMDHGKFECRAHQSAE